MPLERQANLTRYYRSRKLFQAALDDAAALLQLSLISELGPFPQATAPPSPSPHPLALFAMLWEGRPKLVWGRGLARRGIEGVDGKGPPIGTGARPTFRGAQIEIVNLEDVSPKDIATFHF